MINQTKKVISSLIVVLAIFAPQYSYAATQFQFDHDKSSGKLIVTMRFTGANASFSVIKIPEKFWNVDVSEQVGDFEVLTNRARLEKKRPKHIVISHSPGEEVTLRYTVKAARDDNSPYLPKVNSDYIYFIGHALFLRPTHMDSEEHGRFEIMNNTGYTFLASMGKFEDRNFIIDTSYTKLLRSFYFMGEHYKYEFKANGKPVYILFSKNLPSYKANELLDKSPKIIKRHREFFRDDDFPFLLMAYLDFSPFGETRKVGTRFSTATVLWFSYGDVSDMNSLLQIMAHEHIHNWIGGRIQSKPETHYMDKWFNEGFTEYYSRKLNQSVGIISKEEYIRQYNETIALYFGSPYRLLSNATIGDNFWGGEHFSKIAYWRGEIIAHVVDNKIKEYTGKKHDIDTLFAMLMEAARAGEEFSSDLFARKFYELTSREFDKNLLNIREPDLLPKHVKLPNGRNYELSSRQIVMPWCGFSGENAIKKGVIEDLTGNSYASQAGLTEGLRVKDFVVPISGTGGNCSATVIYKNSKDKKFEYPPENKEVTTPYYYPK